MNYLLDTCILSEFTHRQPEKKVLTWLEQMDENQLFLSVVTIGEIQRGIERLPESHRKTDLLVWFSNDLIRRFAPRIVPLDTPTMLLWGSLVARMEQNGKPMSVMDSLIVATALQNNQTIATRNISDFIPCGVQVINPWE